MAANIKEIIVPTMNLEKQLISYDNWKSDISGVISQYQGWLDDSLLSDTDTELLLLKNLRLLKNDTITIAFAAEFSRGKTELINALFFSSIGARLLPSTPGRTTMCPTEILHDPNEKPYLKLLDIDTRLTGVSIEDYKKDAKKWTHIELDFDSTDKMKTSFLELIRTKKVSRNEAKELGLVVGERENIVSIPSWRHAIVSIPHPLLKSGLVVLDTPGLNALGVEPELTLNMLPNVQAMIFGSI